MKNLLKQIYGHPLGLLTDLYQLTMAYGYWKTGMKDTEGCFHLFFRKKPFDGGYAIACGLELAIDFIDWFQFTDDDLEYLSTIKGSDEKPFFDDAFLDYLRNMDFTLDIDAIPEGTMVFPFQPLLRVKGPIPIAQILETPMVNLLNFSTLIATKSARLRDVAGDDPILEFGLRRAQGIDGGISASRATIVGGCDATSNILAGKLLGVPVKGTHAHSWVMAYDSEMESFQAWAEAMPNNSVFLVDTFDSLEGTKKAIEAGKWLRDNGHKFLGIRLDSGDLAYLSIEARKMMDDAGFTEAKVFASGDLDEHLVQSLREQNCRIAVWGVGTKLVTAYDQPALGGVYKLSAVRKPGDEWSYRLKLSEQIVKTSNPGLLQVRRFYRDGEPLADAIYDEPNPPKSRWTIIDPFNETRRKHVDAKTRSEDLLVPIFRNGQRVYTSPPIEEMRQRTKDQLKAFHPGVRRFTNPHEYPAGLERNLYKLKQKMILENKGEPDE